MNIGTNSFVRRFDSSKVQVRFRFRHSVEFIRLRIINQDAVNSVDPLCHVERSRDISDYPHSTFFSRDVDCGRQLLLMVSKFASPLRAVGSYEPEAARTETSLTILMVR